ncbi:hypothetical protein BTN50_1167 [Candidatus Enterovibrio altilux]|uniref:Mobile element protein n=1 Tax=Candidatus Enterovibrio altilux TaxID=1927128 RepID=A0A291B9F7_9GAMM|nr:hypothetical protein BTN50_1167 [Candidatus Enterovibrio luxaltus]
MHQIITIELSASNVIDGAVLPNLLKPTRRKINEVSAESVDGTKECTKSFVLNKWFHPSY